ncbi:bifunctional DNA primase/polymerase [Sulfurisphaera ohwakuensis]|uniref:bifunctional DNA primase/polymerase n=1 Tax=Sulfurisphaera ohwakuensis TaxID=69656 RepID=UPI0036F3936F
MSETVLDYALFYHSYGLSVIPLKPKEKVPLIEWRRYQQEMPSINEINRWFKDTNNNIAVVCGKISGNLVVIDFDDEQIYTKFIEELKNHPELSEVVNNTWLVKTGKGYHIYLRVDNDEPVRTAKLPKIDIKGEGGYVVAPPSIHPSGKRYEFVRFTKTTGHEIRLISEKQYKDLLAVLERVSGGKIEGEDKSEAKKNEEWGEERKDEKRNKRLKEDAILKLIDIISPVYKEGYRHTIILYLIGWLYKAGITETDAEKLVRIICDKFNDEECEDRLRIVKETYSGVREEKAKAKGKELKTSGGLLNDVFTHFMTEDEALEKIREIEEILKSASPFKKDPIFAPLNLAKKRYAIALPDKKIIVVGRITEDGKVEYEDIVFNAYPSKVVVYQNPLDPTKITFETVWRSKERKLPIKLPPLLGEEILQILSRGGLVQKSGIAKDILNAILNAYIRKGKAKIKTDVDAKGFFLLNGELKANRVQVSKPRDEDVRKALEIVNKLRGYYDEGKLAYVLAWGLASPFNFTVKQKLGNRASDVFPYLILYGESNTGKSTLSIIACMISGTEKIANESCTEVNATNVDTKAKLGMFLNDSTFMKPVKEAWGLFKDIEMVEMLKDVVDNTQARARIEEKSNIRVFLALRPLLITLNRVAGVKFPEDSGFRRRYKIIPFTLNDKKKVVERVEEFNKNVYLEVDSLGYIGMLFVHEMINNKDLQKRFFERPIDTAKEFLKGLLEKYGFDSGWVDKDPEFEMTENEVDIEALRIFFINKINDTYQKYIGKLILTAEDGERRYMYTSNINFRAKIDAIIDSGLLPWLVKKDDKYIITTGINKDEDFRKMVGELTLKDLKELLNEAGVHATYKDARYKKNPHEKVNSDKSKVVIIDHPDEFEKFLTPTFEDFSQ